MSSTTSSSESTAIMDESATTLLVDRLNAVHSLFKLYVASFLLLLGINSALFTGLISLSNSSGTPSGQAGHVITHAICVCGLITGTIYSGGVIPQFWVSARLYKQVDWAINASSDSAVRNGFPKPRAIFLHTTSAGILLFSLATLAVWVWLYLDVL